MCKNLDSPHPLTPSPIFGIRGTRIMSPLSHLKGEGLGVREMGCSQLTDLTYLCTTPNLKSAISRAA